MGTPVNLTARVMAAAQLGEVWGTETLFQSLGPGRQGEGPFQIQAKGFDEPVPVFHIHGLQMPRRVGRAVPLVGRDQEMSLLRDRLENARQGQGSLISVVGEAGVGKSRLVAEAIETARSLGLRVLEGHTPSYGERIPYTPWSELLREHVGWTSDTTVEQRTGRLKRHLAGLQDNQAEWAPVVAEALGLSLPDTPMTAGLAPRFRRQRFFDLTLQMVQQAADENPLLIVLEDLHWAGPLAEELLTYLGRNIAQSSVTILGTYRPVDGALPGEELPHHRSIPLAALPIERCQDMVVALTGCQELDPILAGLIWERAQGNPLYVKEIVQVLQEQGALVQDNGSLRLLGDPETAALEIPPTIQEVILSRIDHLREGPRSVLRVAAVIDQEFLFPVLVGVFPFGDAEPVLRQRTERLCQAEMLTPMDADQYAFRHALTREVAYGSILHTRRRVLHEQVGKYYEQHFGDRLEQHYGFLAHHFRHSANQSKALEYTLRAGRQAAHSYANEAAAAYFRQALEIATSDPGLLSPRETIQIHRERGDVLSQAGRFAEALECYEQALRKGAGVLDDIAIAQFHRLCCYVHERCGRYEESLNALQRAHRVLLRHSRGMSSLEMAHVLASMSGIYMRTSVFEKAATLGQEALVIAQKTSPGRERSSLLGRIHMQQGNACAMVGQYGEAQHCFERALRFREQAGERPEIASTYNNLGYLWFLQDEYEKAIESYRRCLEVARQVGDPYIAAYAANNLGSAWNDLGDYDLATEYCRESLAVRERIGDQYGMASCWDTMGLVHTARGEYEQAIELHRRSLGLKRKMGETFQEANSLVNLSLTHLAKGETNQALSLADSALGILEELETQTLLPEAHIAAAQALARLNKPGQAREHAQVALEIARETGQRKFGAVAARVLAGILASDASADSAEVEQLFRESIKTLADIGCRLEWGRACRSYGRFLNAIEQPDKARECQEKARRLFEEIGVHDRDIGEV
jgi:predicted ATPase